MNRQSGLEGLVMSPLRRHRHDLPADQLDALVLEQDARGRHLLQLGHGEAPARQAFGRGGGPLDDGGHHDKYIARLDCRAM
jgi:hypothetical protein